MLCSVQELLQSAVMLSNAATQCLKSRAVFRTRAVTSSFVLRTRTVAAHFVLHTSCCGSVSRAELSKELVQGSIMLSSAAATQCFESRAVLRIRAVAVSFALRTRAVAALFVLRTSRCDSGLSVAC